MVTCVSSPDALESLYTAFERHTRVSRSILKLKSRDLKKLESFELTGKKKIPIKLTLAVILLAQGKSVCSDPGWTLSASVFPGWLPDLTTGAEQFIFFLNRLSKNQSNRAK